MLIMQRQVMRTCPALRGVPARAHKEDMSFSEQGVDELRR